MTSSIAKKFPNTHVFYGYMSIEKAVFIRKAAIQLLETNPDMSYVVLGDDAMEQYSFDEGYNTSDISLRTDGTHLKFLTDADIIIIPEIRYPRIFAILQAAATTGKHVFTSIDATNETLLPKLNSYNNSMIALREASTEGREQKTIPSINSTNEIFKTEDLSDVENSFNLHEVSPLPQESEINSETKVTYHGFDESLLGERNVTIFFGDNPANLGAIIKDSLATFHGDEKLQYFTFGGKHKIPEMPENYTKGKIACKYEGRDIVAASTDVDVIVIPLIGGLYDMKNLTIALTTGKPVIAGINASNTHNVNQIIESLHRANTILNPSLTNVVEQNKEVSSQPVTSRITRYVKYSTVVNNEVSVTQV